VFSVNLLKDVVSRGYGFAECYFIEKGLAVQIRKFKIIVIENKAC